jgi:hypothetical protein
MNLSDVGVLYIGAKTMPNFGLSYRVCVDVELDKQMDGVGGRFIDANGGGRQCRNYHDGDRYLSASVFMFLFLKQYDLVDAS